MTIGPSTLVRQLILALTGIALAFFIFFSSGLSFDT